MNQEEGTFKFECNTRHDSNSHVKFKGKFLAPCQKAAVVRAVQNDPNCTGNTVIRNMVNIADERVQIDHGLKDSVDRLVGAERDLVLSRNLGGMKVAGNQNDEVQAVRHCIETTQFGRIAYSGEYNVDYEHAMAARYSLWDDDGQ